MMLAHASMKNSREPVPAGQAGFSLFEVMVAMVIMMVGLMGLAAMQDIALSGNMDANEVTRVTALATDMIDRISYNKKNVLAYAGPACPACIDTLAATPCTQPAATQAQARGDCLQWDFRVDNSGLRNARGVVTVAPAGPILPNSTAAMLNVVNITITWTGAKRAKSITMSSVVAID